MTNNKQNNKIAIIGLGNPDISYQNTRHNTGCLFIDYLAEKYSKENWKNNKNCLAKINLFELNNYSIILAKPLVFMNQSGKTVKLIKKFYNLPLKNIVIAHDDTDIVLGNFKIHFGRGSAGHKGIESIIHYLKSKNFYRIRIGIRLPSQTQKADQIVMKNFSIKEKQNLNNIFPFIEENLMKIYTQENKLKNEKLKSSKDLAPKH